MTYITSEDKLTINQCFNLAHAEMLKYKQDPDDGYLISRTIELFNLNKKIKEVNENEQELEL